MTRENYEYAPPSLERVERVIEEIETNRDGLGKFKNTAIYDSFVYTFAYLKAREE